MPSFEFTPWQWIIAMIAAYSIGLSKTGFAGVGLVGIYLMTEIMPARESTGRHPAHGRLRGPGGDPLLLQAGALVAHSRVPPVGADRNSGRLFPVRAHPGKLVSNRGGRHHPGVGGRTIFAALADFETDAGTTAARGGNRARAGGRHQHDDREFRRPVHGDVPADGRDRSTNGALSAPTR